MNKGGLKKISKQTVYDAIAMNAGWHAVHPLRDELTKLIWDKTPRLGKWLSTYMGTPDDPYHRGIGQMFLIAAVARIMEPGCKVDYILVLEGKQGVGKSSVCAIIGGEYFSDSLPNLSTGKEASQHLAGRWIIELSELAATSKAETEQLKAFTTRRCEKYRPPYARTEVVQPRQCVFIGTTNKSAYLRDETGARRFWPVKVGTVDLNALTTDRDQLLAEAMALYDAGEDWFPDREFETKFIMPQQRERFEEDVWEEPVREYLIQLDPKIAYVGDILTQGLHVETQKHNRADQNRVTAILLNLGWGRLKKDSKGNQPWGPEKLVHQ